LHDIVFYPFISEESFSACFLEDCLPISSLLLQGQGTPHPYPAFSAPLFVDATQQASATGFFLRHNAWTRFFMRAILMPLIFFKSHIFPSLPRSQI